MSRRSSKQSNDRVLLQLTKVELKIIIESLESTRSTLEWEIQHCDPECTDDIDEWRRQLAAINTLHEQICE